MPGDARLVKLFLLGLVAVGLVFQVFFLVVSGRSVSRANALAAEYRAQREKYERACKVIAAQQRSILALVAERDEALGRLRTVATFLDRKRAEGGR